MCPSARTSRRSHNCDHASALSLQLLWSFPSFLVITGLFGIGDGENDALNCVIDHGDGGVGEIWLAVRRTPSSLPLLTVTALGLLTCLSSCEHCESTCESSSMCSFLCCFHCCLVRGDFRSWSGVVLILFAGGVCIPSRPSALWFTKRGGVVVIGKGGEEGEGEGFAPSISCLRTHACGGSVGNPFMNWSLTLWRTCSGVSMRISSYFVGFPGHDGPGSKIAFIICLSLTTDRGKSPPWLPGMATQKQPRNTI